MKKIFNPSETQKEGQEQSKKLYRSISEQVRRLDDARSCARNVGDLFTLSLEVQRSKFRDYCERLIFSDPILYGRKAEELLWRKGFYEVISTAKRLKKKEYTSEDKANIQVHINIGIGHYHNFILKLQSEYDINLDGIVDFSLLNIDNRSVKPTTGQLLEHLELSVHRSLIYLGDLCRYRLEIYPNWDPGLAFRYYNQALYFKPKYGMPHNQIGTFVSSLNLNYSLDAAYYYIRCITSKHPFDGTENNLLALFEKNSKYLEQIPVENIDADCIIQQEPAEHIRRFISRFLLLTDIWIFDKKIPHIYDLCHQTNVDLRECLSYTKPIMSENGDTQTDDSVETESINSPSYLHHDIIFKIVVICLLSISRLQALQSSQLSNVIAFTLAVYSQLIKFITNHVQEEILNFPLPPEESNMMNGIKKKGRKIKGMRRRKKINSQSDESDVSDIEIDNESESSSCESLVSDNEDILLSSEDEIEDGINIQQNNIKNEIVNHANNQNDKDYKNQDMDILKKIKRMNASDLLDIFMDQAYMQSVKIINDWLTTDADVLKLCGKNTRPLFNQLVKLINLMCIDLNKCDILKTYNIKDIKNDVKKIALPEDITLKGIEILNNVQNEIVWKSMDNYNMSSKEETLIRILKITSFGHFLCTIEETGLIYKAEEKLFMINIMDEIKGNESSTTTLHEQQNNPNIENGHIDRKINDKTDDTKGQLSKMKHMGQLWLAAEVKDLENRVKDKTSLSPYLVVDADALMKYTSIIKQLIYSRKFIVLVPSAVVSVLDEMKKEKLEAREAIRWLELQFQQGNRFFRAQRHQERLQIPLIKYPRKKDKESYIFIQIIECCHYLAQQQKATTNLVTLLMGNINSVGNNEKDISYVGLAKSAGVNLESIAEFYSKWKKMVKGKR